MKFLHIVAGLLALVSGAVALYALKGGGLHRRSGLVFVYAMLFMSGSGAVIALLKPQRFNVIAGVLTFYLVTTAFLTVRRREAGFPWMDAGALLVGLLAAVAALRFGVDVLRSPTGRIESYPPAVGFMFGGIALMALAGDIRMMAVGGLQGARRIARHVWRMCLALFIAAASFFLGQAQIFPKEVRQSGLLMVPVLAVLVLMFYWLARVKFTRRFQHA